MSLDAVRAELVEALRPLTNNIPFDQLRANAHISTCLTCIESEGNR